MTDKMVAADTVDRLYVTALGRHADSSSSTSDVAGIMNGSLTEASIANGVISSAEFTSDYGTLDDDQFVNRVYENGLGRAATAQEISTWGGMLDAGTLSKADLVVAMADSPDHLAVANAASSASMHQMIQAMAVSRPAASHDAGCLERIAQIRGRSPGQQGSVYRIETQSVAAAA